MGCQIGGCDDEMMMMMMMKLNDDDNDELMSKFWVLYFYETFIYFMGPLTYIAIWFKMSTKIFVWVSKFGEVGGDYKFQNHKWWDGFRFYMQNFNFFRGWMVFLVPFVSLFSF